MKTIFKNLLQAVGVICYFIVLDFAYARMDIERLSRDIEFFAGVFLGLGILLLEIAYNKDNGKTAVTGIELLCLSFHSLSIMHFMAVFECDFRFYLIVSSIIVTIYYVLKAIISYTKEKKAYLKTLSDISEIVKEDEPIKKEAKKRRKEDTEKENVKKEENDEPKKELTKNKQVKSNKNKAKSTGKGKQVKKATTKKKSKNEKTTKKEIENKNTKKEPATKKRTENKKVKSKKEGKEND